MIDPRHIERQGGEPDVRTLILSWLREGAKTGDQLGVLRRKEQIPRSTFYANLSRMISDREVEEIWEIRGDKRIRKYHVASGPFAGLKELDFIVEEMRSPDADERIRGAANLTSIARGRRVAWYFGKKTSRRSQSDLQVLVGALADSSPEIRRRMLEAFSLILYREPGDTGSRRDLVEAIRYRVMDLAFQEKDSSVRSRAISLLGQIDPEDALEAVYRIIRDESVPKGSYLELKGSLITELFNTDYASKHQVDIRRKLLELQQHSEIAKIRVKELLDQAGPLYP